MSLEEISPSVDMKTCAFSAAVERSLLEGDWSSESICADDSEGGGHSCFIGDVCDREVGVGRMGE